MNRNRSAAVPNFGRGFSQYIVLSRSQILKNVNKMSKEKRFKFSKNERSVEFLVKGCLISESPFAGYCNRPCSINARARHSSQF